MYYIKKIRHQTPGIYSFGLLWKFPSGKSMIAYASDYATIRAKYLYFTRNSHEYTYSEVSVANNSYYEGNADWMRCFDIDL